MKKSLPRTNDLLVILTPGIQFQNVDSFVLQGFNEPLYLLWVVIHFYDFRSIWIWTFADAKLFYVIYTMATSIKKWSMNYSTKRCQYRVINQPKSILEISRSQCPFGNRFLFHYWNVAQCPNCHHSRQLSLYLSIIHLSSVFSLQYTHVRTHEVKHLLSYTVTD